MKSKILVIALAFVMVFAFSFGVLADTPKTIYVDAAYTGTDSDGTADKPYATMSAAVSAAADGDTLALAAGTYEIGDFNIAKAVNLKGAGADKTTLQGRIQYQVGKTAAEGDTISVSDLKMVPGNSSSHQGLCWNNNNTLEGYALKVENCVFDGWKFAIGVNSGAKDCTLTVSNTTFTNVWCGVNVNEANGNSLAAMTLTKDSDAVYAAQVFDLTKAESEKYNAYYDTFENLEKDTDHSNPTWDAVNDADAGNVPNAWPAEAMIGNFYYDTLQDAVNNAQSGDTINLVSDITLTEAVEVPAIELTIAGNNNTLSFDYEHPGLMAAFTKDPSGLEAGTKLTIKDLAIVNSDTENASCGYGVLIGFSSTGTVVDLQGCTLKNLYTGVYVNPMKTDAAGPTISITGCTYEDTTYGYSIDEVTAGSYVGKSEVTFEDNEGDVTESETWQSYSVTNKDGVTKAYSDFDSAVAAAENGDTINLGVGTYEIGYKTVAKVVNFKGAGADKTVVKGTILYGANSGAQNPDTTGVDTIKVSDLTMQQDGSDLTYALGWAVINDGSPFSGFDLVVENCKFVDYKFGFTVSSHAADCDLIVKDSAFNSVYCIAGVMTAGQLQVGGEAKDFTNTVKFENVTSSNVVYEVQSFTNQSGDDFYNLYFDTYENYEKNEPTWDAKADPDGGVNPDVWPAEAKIGEDYYSTLQNALDNAEDNDVVTILDEVTGTVTLENDVDGLTITGTKDAKIKDGKITSVSNGVNLTNLTIQGLTFENAAISFSPNANSDFSNLTIKDNTFTGGLDGFSAVHLNFGSLTGSTTGPKFDGLAITGNTIKDIAKGTNSGILVLGDKGTDAANAVTVTIKDNTIDGVGWNGIQLNGINGKTITVENNDIRNCGATGDDGVLNLYKTSGETFTIKENKIITANDTQKYISYINDDVDATYNFWGTVKDGAVVSDPNYADKFGYMEGAEVTVSSLPYYEKETMKNPDDLKAYEVKVATTRNGKVTVDNEKAQMGAKVTITATPNKGYELTSLKVVGADNKEVKVAKDNSFTMPGCDVTITAVFSAGKDIFNDIKEGAWYYDNVITAANLGLINGFPDGSFRPNGAMTRAQFVTVLGRYENVDVDKYSADGYKFTDIGPETTKWAGPYIAWAVENQIVEGTSETTFEPSRDIARQEMATIIARYFTYKGETVDADWNDDVKFTDKNKVADWAQEGVADCVELDMIQGFEDKTFRPADSMTRAQGATVLVRIVDFFE